MKKAALPKIKDSYVEPPPNQEELDQLVALWDLHAPTAYKGLLKAKSKTLLEQTKQPYKGRFIWDDTTKHYVEVGTGRVLSRVEIHKAFSQFVENYSSRS